MRQGICLFVLLISVMTGMAEAGKTPWQLPPLLESKAYQDFKLRPDTEQSKLLYLIDRFQDSGVQVGYNRVFFDSPLAARVARWFLLRFYRGETVDEWLVKWCYRSVPSGDLIWCKFPDGTKELSLPVLKGELEALNQAMKQS